jgi:hypothetical protein
VAVLRGLCLAWLALGCARVGAMKVDDGGAADRPGVDLQVTLPDGAPLPTASRRRISIRESARCTGTAR